MDLTDSFKAHPAVAAHDYFRQLPERLLTLTPGPKGLGAGCVMGGRLPRAGGKGIVAYHKELAEGDVWEDVVCLVLPTDLLRLLPKVGELLC